MRFDLRSVKMRWGGIGLEYEEEIRRNGGWFKEYKEEIKG